MSRDECDALTKHVVKKGLSLPRYSIGLSHDVTSNNVVEKYDHLFAKDATTFLKSFAGRSRPTPLGVGPLVSRLVAPPRNLLSLLPRLTNQQLSQLRMIVLPPAKRPRVLALIGADMQIVDIGN